MARVVEAMVGSKASKVRSFARAALAALSQVVDKPYADIERKGLLEEANKQGSMLSLLTHVQIQEQRVHQV